jgi:hypothetical protein
LLQSTLQALPISMLVKPINEFVDLVELTFQIGVLILLMPKEKLLSQIVIIA